MNGTASLPVMTDQSLKPFLATPRAILILTRSTCGHCQAYQAEVAALQARGHLAGWQIGILVLDRPGATEFKRANPWLAGLAALPYTLIYFRGQRVDCFATSRGGYLLERLADLLPDAAPERDAFIAAAAAG